MLVRRHGRSAAAALLLGLAAVTTVSCLSTTGTTGTSPSTRTAPPSAGPTAGYAAGPAAAHRQRPNIILLTTDDQNIDELRLMPRTRRLLAGHGVTFTRAMSPDPLCCPARAEMMTGQLGQNNGVSSNLGLHGGFQALRQKQNTLAVWLSRTGYRTAMVGKYLNFYTAADGRQHGWTHWNPSVGGVYTYSRTTFYEDGTPRTFHRNVDPVIAHHADRYVREFSASGRPFFIWASFLSPHARRLRPGGVDLPPLPTSRHRDDLLGVRAPALSDPSFGRTHGPQLQPRRLESHVTRPEVQTLFTRRVQSLLDVDDEVARLVRTLRETGELGNTYIFLASDNGVLLGQHDMLGKDMLYQQALRVPLVVRVPGVRHGRTSQLPVTLTDLTPTILSLANSAPGRLLDGRSFVRALHGHRLPWRDTQLIQTGRHASTADPARWAFRGVWTHRYTFMRRVADGATFLFDRRVDPYETTDVAGWRRYQHTAAELGRRTRALVHCAGATCNRRFGPVPGPTAPAGRAARPGTPRQ